jgi:general secretion pathway protein L
MAVIADQTPFKTTPAAKSVARRLGLIGFFGWWKRELSAAMPATLRAFSERRRARPVLAFDGNTATLWRPTEASGGVTMAESARIALDGESSVVASAGRAALAPLLAAGRAPQLVVSLSPRASLRKSLTLPMAIEDHLRQALAYDLDRHTPFKPDELYFDAVVVDRDPARNTLRVDLAAARRNIVDEVVRQAESFGARVVAVTVDPPRAAWASPVDLLPEDRRLPWCSRPASLPRSRCPCGRSARKRSRSRTGATRRCSARRSPMRCARSSIGASTITTSRSSASTRIRAHCRCWTT